VPIQVEALEMIAHKIGRILSGDPNHQDHWDDIAGYAKLVSERLQGKPQYTLVPQGTPIKDTAVAKPAVPFILPTSK
jgi:hypothetical protein